MTVDLAQLELSIAGRVLVTALSARIEPHQLWCVLGRNGCGKSTLLRTVAGLLKPAAGQVHFDGKPLGQWEWRALARHRAYLPQAVTDVFGSSVFETVMAARFPHHPVSFGGLWGLETEEDRELALAGIRELGLETLASRNVQTLSGGERQRVSLAALFVQQPELALLDEPTASLDLDGQHLCMRLLREKVDRAGHPKMALVALHDPNLAVRYATHALLFQANGVVESGPVDTVLTENSLSRSFGHPVRMLQDGANRWFIAV